jgi:hypothetical protein
MEKTMPSTSDSASAIAKARKCVTNGPSHIFQNHDERRPFFMGRLCDKIRPARLKGSREANAEFQKTAATLFRQNKRVICGRYDQNLN